MGLPCSFAEKIIIRPQTRGTSIRIAPVVGGNFAENPILRRLLAHVALYLNPMSKLVEWGVQVLAPETPNLVPVSKSLE